MASISQHFTSGLWHIQFRLGGQNIHKSLDTDREKEARSLKVRVEDTLREINIGRLIIPSGADVWQFILSEGKLTHKPAVEKVHTLADLFDAYFDKQTAGAKEANTLKTERIHRRHLERLLGKSKLLAILTVGDLQNYINTRARQKWKGKPIRAQTIKKEMDTLKAVWGRSEKLLDVRLGMAPFADLTFPKGKEKPSFQTWNEITRTIERGKLSAAQQEELWSSLFLDDKQVEELLDFVRDRKTRTTYVYPLFVFAAHTGARLSEIIRSRVADLKFDDNRVVIRELTKKQSKETYRNVPMSKRLRAVLEQYLKTNHPGGAYTICREADEEMLPSTLHEARDWFFRDSKWAVLPGYHVLRHSFASNLARRGVDQRTIDDLMGHQTEEMRQRYRHLFPEQRANAIQLLFDRD